MILSPLSSQRPAPPKPEPKAKKAAKVRDEPASQSRGRRSCVSVRPPVDGLFCLPLQKEKAVNDKKEDKKTKKAKENAEAEANEENHSENGEAKTNEVGRR